MQVRIDDIKKIADSLSDKKNGKTFFITGATGFLGKYLTYALLYAIKWKKSNIKVIISTQNVHKAKEIFAEYLDCNQFFIYHNRTDLSYQVKQHIDYIIHAAANTNKRDFRAKPYTLLKENIHECEKVLHLAKEKSVKKIVLLSTAQVYGQLLSRGELSEDELGGNQSMNALACYAESKRTAEYLFASSWVEYKVPCNVIRLFSVYGPGMKLESETVFSDLYTQAVTGKDIIIQGNGKAIRNWGYITDVITGIFVTLFEGNTGEAYNVGSNTENLSILQLAQTLCGLIGKNQKVIMLNENEKTLVKESMQIPSLKKINCLGYHSKISLQEGLSRMLYE